MVNLRGLIPNFKMGGSVAKNPSNALPLHKKNLQDIINNVRGTQPDPSFDLIVAQARARGLSSYEIADMSGLDLKGIIFNGEGIKLLRGDDPALQTLKPNVEGADLRGIEVRPYSTLDELDLGEDHAVLDDMKLGQTQMQGMVFKGFDHAETSKTFTNGQDVSYLIAKGQNNGGVKQFEMNFEGGVKAHGMDVSDARVLSINIRKEAGKGNHEAPDLAGLKADYASNFRFDTHTDPEQSSDISVMLDGANFEHATFAPGSSLANASLRGANLSHMKFVELDMRRADLTGADLTGVELSRANLEHAKVTYGDLQKAQWQGQPIAEMPPEQLQQLARDQKLHIISPEQAQEVMHNVEQAIAKVEDGRGRWEGWRESLQSTRDVKLDDVDHHAWAEKAAAIPTPETDAMIKKMFTAYRNMTATKSRIDMQEATLEHAAGYDSVNHQMDTGKAAIDQQRAEDRTAWTPGMDSKRDDQTT